VYYAASSLDVHARTGGKASYVVPSGNLGNVAACLWARRMGLPIDRIVLAHNANRTVPEFLETGRLQPRPSVATLASAMDVGNPSNLERLMAMFPGHELAQQVSACSIADEDIRRRIRADHAAYGMTWCPHTATAAEAWARLPEDERATRLWVLVATAHPAKFREIVEPLAGPVPVPENLQHLYDLPSRFSEIGATLSELVRATGD
jgi:threonine synthase